MRCACSAATRDSASAADTARVVSSRCRPRSRVATRASLRFRLLRGGGRGGVGDNPGRAQFREIVRLSPRRLEIRRGFVRSRAGLLNGHGLARAVGLEGPHFRQDLPVEGGDILAKRGEACRAFLERVARRRRIELHQNLSLVDDLAEL